MSDVEILTPQEKTVKIHDKTFVIKERPIADVMKYLQMKEDVGKRSLQKLMAFKSKFSSVDSSLTEDTKQEVINEISKIGIESTQEIITETDNMMRFILGDLDDEFMKEHMPLSIRKKVIEIFETVASIADLLKNEGIPHPILE